MIDHDATFLLIERVFHQALLDTRSIDHNTRMAAEHWLDCMAPDWRERRQRRWCKGEEYSYVAVRSGKQHKSTKKLAENSIDRW